MTQADLSELLAQTILFLQESADFQLPPVRDVLHLVRHQVIRLYRRVTRARGRYVVALVGLSNVGKSTLLNSLLGCDLAPRRNGPCTPVPIEFAAGVHGQVTVLVEEDFRPHRRCFAAMDDLRLFLETLISGAPLSDNRPVSRVVVELGHPLLQQGLVLADTPGFGAAESESSDGPHEQRVKAYLRNEVSQVFWVVRGYQGIGHRERVVYDQLFAELCDDVIVTGGEDWDASDRVRFQGRYRALFQERLPTFHFVGRSRSDEVGVVADRIRSLQPPEARIAQSVTALKQLARDLSEWISGHHSMPALDSGIWRPDSWARLCRAPACDGLRDELLALWRTSK